MNNAVLIVEDNATLAKNIARYLRRHGYDAHSACDASEAFSLISSIDPRVVLIDYALPGVNGLDILHRLQQQRRDVKAVMITGQGSVEVAVEAMKSGACDYLSKPLVLGEVKRVVDKAMADAPPPRPEEPGLVRRPSTLVSTSRLEGLLGESAPMLALKEAVGQLLDSEYAVRHAGRPALLITGEVGTGKELLARTIHADGPCGAEPFVTLDCASMTAALIDAALPGAARSTFLQPAADPAADDLPTTGTLFLDEVGELEPSLQPRLLRVIEAKPLRRSGLLRDGRAPRRFIASTSHDLEQMAGSGRFRPDLLLRLKIVHLHVPPLRERGQDVLLLARHFLRLHGDRYGKAGLSLSPAAERALLQHAWPGNVRELHNCIERTVALTQDSVVGEALLALRSPGADRVATPRAGATGQPLGDEQVQDLLLQHALQRTNWNIVRAAKLLGLAPDALRYRMEQRRIKAPQAR